jgi:tetratricopeptide (TPR) repeat protein
LPNTCRAERYQRPALFKGTCMPLDPYQPCPCGLDKKVKFCCGSEIVGELNKIHDLVGGEQRLGAIDHINRLLAVNPNRGCLLLEKASIQIELREFDAAKKTVNELLTVLPSNPSGLSLLATLEAAEGKVDEAVDTLQQALESAQGRISGQLYQAISVAARALVVIGEPLAARGHLLFQVGATDGQERTSMAGLLELEGSGQIPLAALGLDRPLAPEASGRLSAAGIAEFNAALKDAGVGCWLRAAQKLEALAEREPYDPAVWRNIGIFRSWLGHSDRARAALRRYASFASVPRDDAVETEAAVQFLTEASDIDTLPEVTLTYAITDASALQEQLLSNRRLQSVQFDAAAFREDGEVPPLSVFMLLDREVPANSDGLTLENVPTVVGELLLFGKQTDRAARVEVALIKNDQYDDRKRAVEDVLGQFSAGLEKEEETGRVSRVAAALSLSWRLPDNTPHELRKQMVAEHRRNILLNVWPDLPQGVLDGKSLRQAAADASMQVRVLATILLADLSEVDELPVYNEVRRAVGLPTVEPLDPQGLRVVSLSPARLARVDVKKLGDDDLLGVLHRGMMMSSPRILRRVGLEIAGRPTMAGKVDKAELFEILAKMSTDSDEALAHIHQAQEAATAAGKSPARFLIAEIPIRIQRREIDEFKNLFDRLSARHINEPGVAQALQSILYQLGLLRPDGSMAPPRGGAPAAGPVAAAAPAPASSLWTPDQGAPAAPAGKSKLIIPGMD